MKNFWKKLPKNFVALAPMAGVTDFPFREMISEIGKPDIFFTEFVSTEHIARVSEIPLVLKYSENQRPIIAQFFGAKPEQFERCAKLAIELGFDGIDINMGCPDKKVLKQGAGSELIKNPELAREIIRVVKKVVGDKIPVSIKTRLGYDKKDIRNWILDVLEEGVDAITIHGRTAKQGYGGSADWELIGEITKEIKKKFKEIIVIGNGDIKDLAQGKALAEKYGLDGVMIGRTILKNPWVFSGEENISLERRKKAAQKHTELFQKFYVHHVKSNKVGAEQFDRVKDAGIGTMKKYYKSYLSGFEIRKDLMNCKNFEEAKKLLK